MSENSIFCNEIIFLLSFGHVRNHPFQKNSGNSSDARRQKLKFTTDSEKGQEANVNSKSNVK